MVKRTFLFDSRRRTDLETRIFDHSVIVFVNDVQVHRCVESHIRRLAEGRQSSRSSDNQITRGDAVTKHHYKTFFDRHFCSNIHLPWRERQDKAQQNENKGFL